MERQYDCFLAVSAHGPVDLVAIKGDEVLKMNVKTVLGKRKLPPPGDVDFLLVHGDGSCELVKALSPARRALPLRDRRPRRQVSPRYRYSGRPTAR
jgi:hypothetical protein